MKNKLLLITFLVIISYLCNCGGGFETDGSDAEEFKESILGVDSL